MSILKSIKKIIKYRGLLGPTVVLLARHQHHGLSQRASLGIIQEAVVRRLTASKDVEDPLFEKAAIGPSCLLTRYSDTTSITRHQLPLNQRPLSALSINSGHSPMKEVDAMISMLGGGQFVLRRSSRAPAPTRAHARRSQRHDTPPLSSAEGSSMSDGSQSSIHMPRVFVILSNATHPTSSTAQDRVVRLLGATGIVAVFLLPKPARRGHRSTRQSRRSWRARRHRIQAEQLPYRVPGRPQNPEGMQALLHHSVQN
ncbi:hypothetical protein DFH07DRAFT_954218 [Mycena maculata]|uniref:Uncharacterized protein n=1 Tax=Mycena maculata TaxID=230809 RepID=A0AAD7JU79_9AGAR|nr:hypothetical protein DFH07DRAFT_954218 [Mycena maculata]